MGNAQSRKPAAVSAGERVRRRDGHVDTDTVTPARDVGAGGQSGGRCFSLREAGRIHRLKVPGGCPSFASRCGVDSTHSLRQAASAGRNLITVFFTVNTPPGFFPAPSGPCRRGFPPCWRRDTGAMRARIPGACNSDAENKRFFPHVIRAVFFAAGRARARRPCRRPSGDLSGTRKNFSGDDSFSRRTSRFAQELRKPRRGFDDAIARRCIPATIENASRPDCPAPHPRAGCAAVDAPRVQRAVDASCTPPSCTHAETAPPSFAGKEKRPLGGGRFPGSGRRPVSRRRFRSARRSRPGTAARPAGPGRWLPRRTASPRRRRPR